MFKYLWVFAIFLAGCSGSSQPTDDEKSEARLCEYDVTNLRTTKHLANYAQLSEEGGTPAEKMAAAQKSIDDALAGMIEECSSLSNGAYRALFTERLAKELGQGSVEISDGRLIEDTAAVGNKRFTGKIVTIYGEKGFSIYLSESDGFVIRIAKPYK